jgi:hypothetical protein
VLAAYASVAGGGLLQPVRGHRKGGEPRMALPLLSIHTALLQPDRQIRRPDGGICRSLWSKVGSNAQEGDRRQSPRRRVR